MRSVPEWMGAKDDARVPTRVRLRVFDKHKGVCQCGCKRGIGILSWQLDHIIALANGGEHRESNLQPVITAHHRAKTKDDMRTKRKITRTRTKHLGQRKPKHPLRSRNRFGEGVVNRRRSGARSSPKVRRVGSRSTQDFRSFRPGLERFEIKLETARLIIERQKLPDGNHLRAMNDRHHMRFSEQRWSEHTPTSQLKAIGASYASEHTQSPWLLFYIRHKLNNSVVGAMGVSLDLHNRIADLSIMITVPNGGVGYGAEAWIAMQDFWLGQKDIVEKIEAGCMEGNNAMYAIFKRAGMTFEGSRPGHFYVGDRETGFARRGVSYWGIP